VAAVVAEEAFQHLKAPILRVCGLDTPIPFSVPLEKIVLPGRADVAAALRRVMR
jgi:acetoin:2,6-dichlorophenolindophenol oxidoreductase subunit beta